MPWFNVDDGLTFHPKVLAVGNGPLGAWVRLGAYCAKHVTDGYVPGEIARMVAGRRELDRLVECGWLHREGDGYRMHDYLDYNRDAAQVARDREKAAERKRRQRARERDRDNRDSHGVSHGVTPPIGHGVTGEVETSEADANPNDNATDNAAIRQESTTQSNTVDKVETPGKPARDPRCHAVTHGVSHAPQAKPSQENYMSSDTSTPLTVAADGGGGDRIEAIANAYAAQALTAARTAGRTISNERAYLARIRRTAREHPDLHRYADGWPTAPPDVIASWLHGDKHSMAYYERTEP